MLVLHSNIGKGVELGCVLFMGGLRIRVFLTLLYFSIHLHYTFIISFLFLFIDL